MPHNLSPFSFQFSPPPARHYHSDRSLWLSVDPMSDKYPSTSSYAYCANNSVRLVDEDGREIGDYYDLDGKYLGWDGIDDGKVYVVTDRNAISHSYTYDNKKCVGIFTDISKGELGDIVFMGESDSKYTAPFCIWMFRVKFFQIAYYICPIN